MQHGTRNTEHGTDDMFKRNGNQQYVRRLPAPRARLGRTVQGSKVRMSRDKLEFSTSGGGGVCAVALLRVFTYDFC